MRRLRKLHLETTRTTPHPYQQPGLGRRPQSGTEVKLAGVQRGQFGGVETDEEQSVAKWISMPGRVMLELGFEGRIQAPQVTRGSSWQNTNDSQKFSSYILLGPCQARGQGLCPRAL